jgi:hypothetical protein
MNPPRYRPHRMWCDGKAIPDLPVEGSCAPELLTSSFERV